MDCEYKPFGWAGTTEISKDLVPPGVIFRRADLSDIPELLRIEEECFGTERFSAEVVRAFIIRSDAFTVVARDETIDRLVGSAACLISRDLGEGRIASVAVLRSYRRRGIGSALLDECERILRGFHLRKAVLEVETTNLPAIHLYKNRGYLTVGLLKDYYGTGRDGYFMDKKISRTTRKVTVK